MTPEEFERDIEFMRTRCSTDLYASVDDAAPRLVAAYRAQAARLEAAEKVCVSADYAVAMHDDTWCGQEYVAELEADITAWQAPKDGAE